MRELYRVLKPGGWAILQVPINLELDNTYEDDSITTPEQRLQEYGYHEHCRYYGLDYKDKLESVGFKVSEVKFTEQFSKQDIEMYGLIEGEIVHYCEKGSN